MNLPKILPPHLKKQFEQVQSFLKRYTKRAYLVGGGVRDIFLNLEIKDLDIEVYDLNNLEFDKLMKKLGALGVGKSFFVYKYGDIDISLPRIEKKKGVGHKAFEVELCNDEKQASKRRDFSMNAMMLDIFEYKFLDFYGGLDCIKNKKICLIDEESFKEDSLRVLRAIQFSARFGFKIDEKTLFVMDDICLKDLSKTRIFWEFEKMFESKNLPFGLYYMYRLHIFEKLFSSEAKSELFCKTAKELQRSSKSFEKELREYYFLYIVANILSLDLKKFLKSLEVPKHFVRALKNQPFFQGLVSDSELKTIAIDMPICKWLGNYKKGIKQKAQKLDIWDKTFDCGVSVSDVISDGFEKEEIKKELRRRKLKAIYV
ncbi:MAG: CCA tRNA nucleotidyltransferase [Epsilonproteobacteria bacterium]|nr:CCA tRNA nucleotidyltransferase [Campylobacterota bacterium]